jgi:hypothetical protein
MWSKNSVQPGVCFKLSLKKTIKLATPLGIAGAIIGMALRPGLLGMVGAAAVIFSIACLWDENEDPYYATGRRIQAIAKELKQIERMVNKRDKIILQQQKRINQILKSRGKGRGASSKDTLSSYGKTNSPTASEQAPGPTEVET